jgi:diaminohydroxyphosphoribosylaminopyrimidine deaminase/5-amino-6-(5-phosphoribosylamino)uracil reductase
MDTASTAEREAMSRAVALAARGLGRTSPNPVVGCVVLDARGEVVGEGFHVRANGGAHAEVRALAEAGDSARGGTAVVTLEPCAHTGRTGPCSDALIAAGVARVVFAVSDPTEAASGGAARLRAAGVAVESGLLAGEARRGNEAWLLAEALGRPHVHWKWAATLDGRSAAADGTSRWITGPEARAEVHTLRDQVDAVLVGTGTALADDPSLDVRPAPADGRQPLAVVVGRRPLPPGSRLAGRTGAVTLATRDPLAALADLHGRGVRSVLLEGGPTLAGAFLRADAVDRVTAYLAPALLGAGPAALGDAGIGSIADALRLELESVERVGDDVRIRATIPRKER